jgi:gluconokinase
MAGDEQAMVVILMGVAGSGKTTVGRALALHLGWGFADADDFHPTENLVKMRAGIALTDVDRSPWLDALHQKICVWTAQNKTGTAQSVVLACSALKQQYRERLTDGVDPAAVRYVWLDGPAELIQARLEQRKGHYMNPALLPSQIDTLEPPAGALRVSIAQDVAGIVQTICAALALEGSAEYKDFR